MKRNPFLYLSGCTIGAFLFFSDVVDKNVGLFLIFLILAGSSYNRRRHHVVASVGGGNNRGNIPR